MLSSSVIPHVHKSTNLSTPSAFVVPFPLLPQMLGNSDPGGTSVERGLTLQHSTWIVHRQGAAPLMPGETVGIPKE